MSHNGVHVTRLMVHVGAYTSALPDTHVLSHKHSTASSTG